MKTSNANVIVYVQDSVDAEQIKQIGASVAGLVGVAQTRPGANARRVVLVDYDPRSVDSQHILGRVREQGFQATLVGM
jgi:predicted nicotinamide N-methyase